MLNTSVKLRLVYHLVGFHIAYFTILVAVPSGSLFWAHLVSLGFVLSHFVFFSDSRLMEFWILLVFIAVGLGLESVLISSQVYQPVAYEYLVFGIVPIWLLDLWAIFAVLALLALKWMHSRPILTAAVCAIGSPMSFLTAQKIGAADISNNFWNGLFIIGLSWAVIVPALMYFVKKATGRRQDYELSSVA